MTRPSSSPSGERPGTVPATCEHHYETRILGGHPLTVRACSFCRKPDWDDLADQALRLYQWGREEGMAGKPPRETLSAYDMPQPSSRHDDGPTVAEAREADRRWPLQKHGE
jgi:hypothetical protein